MNKITPATFVPIGLVVAAIVGTAAVLKYVDTPDSLAADKATRLEGEMKLVQADLLRVKTDIMRVETQALSQRAKEDERWETVLKELTAIKTRLERQ